VCPLAGFGESAMFGAIPVFRHDSYMSHVHQLKKEGTPYTSGVPSVLLPNTLVAT